MKMTLVKALKILKSGNVDLAWEIAQQDEGLLPTVTKEQWLEFAYIAIANAIANGSAD